MRTGSSGPAIFRLRLHKQARRLLLGIPGLLAAVFIAGILIPGAQLWPWHPGMIDLEVYQRTGVMVLNGQDFFHVSDGLPWIYPPFAALLSVPFGLVNLQLAALAWLVICVVTLGALLYRLGLRGWPLSIGIAVIILAVEPVRETIGYGQLGILLVAAVCLDSLPGKHFFSRRILPEGWLTGLATAVKLTPALIAVHNFFSGRRKPGLIAFASFCVATALGFILFAASLYYWNALARGETGVNGSFIFATNQSVLGVWTRLTGSSDHGMLLSVAVIGLGVIASIFAHRVGFTSLGICLAGLTSLLGSPVSWSHHYVWIVPIGIVLWRSAQNAPWPGKRPESGLSLHSKPESIPSPLPGWYRWFGLAYVAWVCLAPFKFLPRDNNVELSYAWWQQIVVNLGVVAGVALLIATFFLNGNKPGEVTQSK